MAIVNKDQDESSRNTIVKDSLQVSREKEMNTEAECYNEDDNDRSFKHASINRYESISSSSCSSFSDYDDDDSFDGPPSPHLKLEMLRLRKPHSTSNTITHHIKHHQNNDSKEEEVVDDEKNKRAQKRQMTTNQELWNAITMLPPLLYALYFCFGGQWLTQSNIDQVQLSLKEEDDWMASFSSSSCIQSSLFPNLHSMPPPTTIANMMATVLHSPCSIYYHLLCAYKIAPGPKRMDHWARRLDQAMIHFMSFMIFYSISANIEYSLLVMVFNIDCMYRLFQKVVRPKRTLYRMIISFTLPLLPLLVRGEIGMFVTLIFINSASGWLFVAYPFGGWSHSAFHLFVFLSNPILCRLSVPLDADIMEGYIDTAAKCAIFARGDVDLDSGVIL